MNSIEKLIEVCKDYKSGILGIKEFQKRHETILLPDELKNTLEKAQHNAFNKLEEIIFCYPEAEYKQYGDMVADDLIRAAIEAKKYLEKE